MTTAGTTGADGRPLVSVLVRTYDGRRGFLREALQSVVRQDYRPIEVVVVEDGSSRYAELVADTLRHEGIRSVHVGIEKVGRCHAGNAALEAATGEFLNFLDDDDQLYPAHLQRLEDILRNHPDAPAAYARSEMVPTTVSTLVPLVYQEKERWLFRSGPFSRWELWQRNLFPIQACLFRRGLYDQHGGFDPRLELLEDWELWVRYLSDATEVPFCEDITSMFRIPGDMTSIMRRERALLEHVESAIRRAGSRRVTVSDRELQVAAEGSLAQIFDSSPSLARAHRRLTGTLTLRPLWWVLRIVASLVPRARDLLTHGRPTTKGQSVDDILDEIGASKSDDTVHDLSLEEIRRLQAKIWRLRDPDRYLVYRVRTILMKSRLFDSRPIMAIRRRLARGAAIPPGGDRLSIEEPQRR